MKLPPAAAQNDWRAGFYRGTEDGAKISDEEADTANQRISSGSSADGLDQAPASFLVPAEQDLGLLFFRQIFAELRKQAHQAQRSRSRKLEASASANCHTCGNKASSSGVGKGDDDDVPIEAFQRAFERLFYVLGDEEPFDASVFDDNKNGYVGWSEFSCVFKKKKIRIRHTAPERIYLTFDNPDCCQLASITSAFILLTIIVSSLSFILSTTPECQKDPVGDQAPEPQDFLGLIEHICLVIFVIEYFIRLGTCWAVNEEVTNRERLLELTIGFEVINLSTPGWRLFRFLNPLASPANFIDLVAILPGIIGWILDLLDKDGLDGGAFVVLRLVRLTRIFRAFKNPAFRQVVVVIAQTLSDSTKALYVLAFNLLLGILIMGSLMWLAEQGDWTPETRSYKRVVGEFYNRTSGDWEDTREETHFPSIPQAFWWALVTATTVGYGDMYPTTALGKVVAGAMMIYSLVILALPVGVIGSNFSAAWDTYEIEKKERMDQTESDKKFIVSAIQRIDPYALSKRVLIEVWNERFPSTDDDPDWTPREGMENRPNAAEFMGEVNLRLDLSDGQGDPDADPPGVDITRKLSNNDPNMPKRHVSGSITFRYEWQKSDSITIEKDESQNLGDAPFRRLSSAFPTLKGTLKIYLISADGLINLNWQRGGIACSNPYCLVYCYPNSPSVPMESLRPACWRSPACTGNTESNPAGNGPRWFASGEFNFCWTRPRQVGAPTDGDEQPTAPPTLDPLNPMKPSDLPPTPSGSTPALASMGPGMEDQMLDVLNRLSQSVSEMRKEVKDINKRVDEALGSSAPLPIHPEPPALRDRPPSASRTPEPATIASMRMGGSPWLEPRAEAKDKQPAHPHALDEETEAC
jgi:hypothetical protein